MGIGERYPHRWRIIAVSCGINFFLGLNYVWSVLAGPLAQHLNELSGLAGGAALNAGDLAIVFSLANAILPIPMLAAGAINDRQGPRLLVFIGGLLFAAGLFLTGTASSINMLIVTYSILVGMGNGLVYTCTINNTVKFFPDKKGLAGGLTTASYGLGPIVLSPLVQAMVDRSGISSTLHMLGTVVALVVCTGSLFLEKCPQSAIPAPAADDKGMSRPECMWYEMIRQPVFYVMLLILSCGSLMGMMIISQASVIAQEMAGLSPAAAAFTVSIVSACNTSGRLISGCASDRFGRIHVIAAALAAALAGLLLLYSPAGTHLVPFMAGTCLVGLCFGSCLGVYPGLTADRFGLRNNTLNYGLMFLGNSIGAVAGPSLAVAAYDAGSSYRPAFLIAAVLAAAGIAMAFVYKKLVSAASQPADL